MLARLFAVYDWLDRRPLAIVQLAARFGIGATFFVSGWIKFNSFEQYTAIFRNEFQVPLIPPYWANLMATTVELVAPVFLCLGLLARLSTLPMFGVIAVIQIFVFPDAYREHLVWSASLLLILFYGPGKVSLDHWLATRFPGRWRA